MTIEMLETATSAALAHRYVEDDFKGALAPSAQMLAIPDRLLEELAEIIADALVASIERDHALLTADC
jgi:hypothetical protein